MYVHVTGLAVPRKLEVVMFEIGQCVRHVLFTRLDCFAPKTQSIALETHFAFNGCKVAANDQFRPMLHWRSFEAAR